MQWGTCLHWATCRWVTSQNWAQRTRLYLGKMFTYRICPWIHPVSKPIRVKICSLQSTKPLSQLCHLPHRYLIWMWESLISCPFVSLRISPINHLGQTFVEKIWFCSRLNAASVNSLCHIINGCSCLCCRKRLALTENEWSLVAVNRCHCEPLLTLRDRDENQVTFMSESQRETCRWQSPSYFSMSKERLL